MYARIYFYLPVSICAFLDSFLDSFFDSYRYFSFLQSCSRHFCPKFKSTDHWSSSDFVRSTSRTYLPLAIDLRARTSHIYSSPAGRTSTYFVGLRGGDRYRSDQTHLLTAHFSLIFLVLPPPGLLPRPTPWGAQPECREKGSGAPSGRSE